MNAALAIRRLEEAGFSHQQAAGVVEVVQGQVIDTVATRDYVGEQVALVRKDFAEQIGAVRQELAEQIGAVRQDLAREAGAIRQEMAQQIGDARAELLRAIHRQTVWMNGFLVTLLVAVLGLCGVLISKVLVWP